ncbi:MAG: hypothetical protein RIC95_02660 [Vicingaceae bacterium]
MKAKEQFENIVSTIQDKASLKQEIYRNTLETYLSFREEGKKLVEELKGEMSKFDRDVAIEYEEKGDFEFQLKIGGDVILFYMHTNVFDFDKSHSLWKTGYIKEDPSRSFCGMINIYNFLADSFKYNRFDDSGYLIGRAFINKENHFFLEGKRQLGFIHNDFANDTIDQADIREVISQAVLYSMDFDLFTPPYKHVQEISVGQLLQNASGMRLKTAKRLGFKFSFDEDAEE